MRSSIPALCCLLLACSKSEAPAPGAPAGSAAAPSTAAAAPPATSARATEPVKAPAPKRNVLFITIDSLRADMPWNGYARPIAPHLTALSEKCAVYEHAYSVSSYTAKSVATFLSGQYPSTLYRDGFFFAGYAKANSFMAETLSERGLMTMAWTGHLYFARAKGLEQGFQEWRVAPGITFDPETDPNVTSEKMTKLGIELLGKPELATKQFFAWAHYMDPHDEYKRHEESPDFGRKGRDRYDSEVFYTDLWLEKLFEFARREPWWKDTYIVISADHGEAFGEHDMYKHAFELWNVLTAVPLMVCGVDVKPQRISERRSHIDLVPTFYDMLGQASPVALPGKSMLPELTTQGAAEKREPIMLELTEDSHNPPRRALILGDYKLIWSGGPRQKFQLYNLTLDPGEEKELSKAEPERLREMTAAYEAAWAKLEMVEPYGHMKLKEGGEARGPRGPEDAKN